MLLAHCHYFVNSSSSNDISSEEAAGLLGGWVAVAPQDQWSAAWSQKEHSSIYEGDSMVCGRALSFAYE